MRPTQNSDQRTIPPLLLLPSPHLLPLVNPSIFIHSSCCKPLLYTCPGLLVLDLELRPVTHPEQLLTLASSYTVPAQYSSFLCFARPSFCCLLPASPVTEPRCKSFAWVLFSLSTGDLNKKRHLSRSIRCFSTSSSRLFHPLQQAQPTIATMPYNTRRKSLSLPSLGIHVPTTAAARAAAAKSRASMSSNSSDTHTDHPSKRLKRAHAGTVPEEALEQTPPPSPQTLATSVEFDHEPTQIDLEAVNDDIVEAVIVQLQETANRPHLVKELATVLGQSLTSVQQYVSHCPLWVLRATRCSITANQQSKS